MRYLTDLGVIIVATSAITLPWNQTALAIGCDTYYRVTGHFGGCSDVSTEYARELWLQKYRLCLQQQLFREISIYESKVEIYYAELDKGSNVRFEDITLENKDIPSFSLSQNQLTTFKVNADFCDESN